MQFGEQIPNFHFIATNGVSGTLQDYRGQWVVLYFYPKDATPGCTTEGQDFRDAYPSFQALNAVVFGVSKDSEASHERFKSKQQFPFELITDPEATLCNLFDVIQMKTLYGKWFKGIERSTFLINPQGILTRVWRKVKVKGHVAEVLAALKEEAKA